MTRSTRPAPRNRRLSEENAARWRGDLGARYAGAITPEARAEVLNAFDLPFVLDEDTALTLYAAQPALSSTFIQRHLPRGRRAEDAKLPWNRLMGQALGRGDDALHFALYRMQAPPQEWARDVAELARRVSDAQALCEELERRHPQRWRPDLGPRLHALALERGQHVLPYLERPAPEVWSARRRAGYDELVELARRRGWWVLWATLVAACAGAAQYDREVLDLLRDAQTPEADLRQRLLVLAGAWSPLRPDGGRVRANRLLREETLLAMYERFPHLARGPFRAQLEPSAGRPLFQVLQAAIECGDTDLVDHFAARLAGRVERSGAERLVHATAQLAEHLAASPAALGTRAALILERLPPLPRSLRQLLGRNALARLLFERAAAQCLTDPAVARSLLQSQAMHMRALAVGALAGDRPAARAMLAHQLGAVLAALERPLPSPTRRRALRALVPLVAQPDTAGAVIERLRAALERSADPDALALLAAPLAERPALARAGEASVVYRHGAAARSPAAH
jgi:hypothetical protein